MERPNDKWLQRIIIPVLLLVANAAYWEEYDSLWRYLGWSLVGILYVQLVWERLVEWMLKIRERYPDIKQTRIRIALTFLGYIGIAGLAQALFVAVASQTAWAAAPLTTREFIVHLLVGQLAVVVTGAVYETLYFLNKYRDAVQEAEIVQKVTLQNQYDCLKNQINPHFLFNSLSALSALISEDKQRATEFLDEMASVYRYLLQAGQRPLVSIQTETAFIRSFLHLLEARYGTALRWQVAISNDLTESMLPPLTFQTLVENALRHNVLLPDQPLVITIQSTDDGHVEVVNNIQRKSVQVQTRPTGLTDLIARYKALEFPRLVISDDNGYFTVRLPVLSKKQADALVNAA
ncbi:Sensor protein lytS [Fibrisoma limi BUZ 3]|uniref:Sensor protein lytS n=1 Tax=Fibrisoma limi BUZ 3 TaxID=1185876 RepID=I2GDU5_9BACT|nr:histidine kinase [Fibrisoma limi]CCH52069.1 Sensor protein lytS [Fibrisoma limi BUZ 3]